ncbi:unnamed protein product [Clonostachys solani]|uniref:Uncharacterized protein n=1 Tax=Clonostachys solani TaxID=160281 RepID=A0A9P0EID8_9HYPO|nr:unnamed protein product [Clonostachys solani]
MGLFASLCCLGSARDVEPDRPDNTHHTEKGSATGASRDFLQGPSTIPPFLQQLSEYSDTPIKSVLQPYLDDETQLRQSFARGDPDAARLSHLIPLYPHQQSLLTSRIKERDGCGPDKYLMRLSAEKVGRPGAPAIVTSLDQYQTNFEAFSHDWSNVIAAGSSALLPLLPRRDDIDIAFNPAVENPLETYFQEIASASDIDLFLYGLDEDQATRKIIQIDSTIRKNQRLPADGGLTLRTNNAITFISPRWPYRHVQIILRLYKSPSEVLAGFDVDCACVAYDGGQVYTTPRGAASIMTRTNTIDLTRRSPSYEYRLYKYRSHNFDVYWDFLERSRIDKFIFQGDQNPSELHGLARLLFFEESIRNYGDDQNYQKRRRLKKIQDVEDSAPSGYADHEIPYGERFTAPSVRRYVALHSKEAYRFGTIHEVMEEGSIASQNDIEGKLQFITDDPGRQMIGSFHPLTDDDWTDMAYDIGAESAGQESISV